MIAPSAAAELLFRTIGPGADVLERLARLRTRVLAEFVLEVPPVKLRTLPGYASRSFAFTTDIPLLPSWASRCSSVPARCSTRTPTTTT